MLQSSSLQTAANPLTEPKGNKLSDACELTGSVREEGTSTDGVALMGKQTPTLHHAKHTPI